MQWVGVGTLRPEHLGSCSNFPPRLRSTEAESRWAWSSRACQAAGGRRIRPQVGRGCGGQAAGASPGVCELAAVQRGAANSSESLGGAAACLALAEDPPVTWMRRTREPRKHERSAGNLNAPPLAAEAGRSQFAQACQVNALLPLTTSSHPTHSLP